MDEAKPLLSHFLALRKVFIVSVLAVLVAFLLIFYFLSSTLMDFILSPIKERGVEVIFTALSEAMITQLKLSLVAAVIVASPIIIGQIWGFVKPALYDAEIKKVRFWFFVTVFLFLCGVAFCYFCIYSLAVDFFLVAGENVVTPMISIDKYLNFMLSFLLPFGVAFNLPVAIYLTTKIGITTPTMLVKNFKFVVLLIAVTAAFLTPPDVFSQVMLAVPLLVLYCVGILVAKVVYAKKQKELANAESSASADATASASDSAVAETSASAGE